MDGEEIGEEIRFLSDYSFTNQVRYSILRRYVKPMFGF